MNLTEISDILFKAKGVEWGLIQRTEGLERHKSHRIPGGADAWVFGVRRTSGFRVVFGDEHTTVEASGPDLGAVVREVFTKLNLPLPQEFAA